MSKVIEFIKNLPNHSNKDWKDYDKFEIKAGEFGSVCVKSKINKKIGNIDVDLCIIKSIKIVDFREEESRILEILSNEVHSMKYYGSAKDDENVYIYMEYIENVISINDLLSKKQSLNEDQIFRLFKEIANVLRKIHENNIVHRDIKGEHILFLLKDGVTKDNSIETILDSIIGIKFIDFGVSKLVTGKDGSKYYSYTGTNVYIAPEVILRKGAACRKSDVYSLGCVLIKMAGGILIDKAGQQNIPTNISKRLTNIIQRCIVADPNARLDSESLCYLLNNSNKTLSFKKCDINSIDSSKDKHIELELPDQTLAQGTIPIGAKSLRITSSFNQIIEYDAIPESVTYLDLGDEFDIKENGQDLPTDTIKTIRCGFNFSAPINSRSLPQSITDLQLYNYNQAIKQNSIPSSVSYLTLGNNFTHIESLTNLPPSIINLNFGNEELKLSADNNAIGKLVSILNPNISSLVLNENELLIKSN